MSDYPPLTFNVPAPELRPGDTPDFSGVDIPRAGAARRPPVDVDPKEIRDLALMVRPPVSGCVTSTIRSCSKVCVT